MNENIKSFIKKSPQRNKRYKLFDVDVFLKDPLTNNIDIEHILSLVEKIFMNDESLINSVDAIYIGQFKEFKEFSFNAMFHQGIIYITNEQDDVMDMLDDIVHEYAHAIEYKHELEIYSDNKINKEFLSKRKILENRLKDKYDLSEYKLYSLKYNKQIDNFFRNVVGYNKLKGYVKDIFPDAYSATSVNEYFATCFDKYFLSNRQLIKLNSPEVFKKIETILYMEKKNDI